MLHKWEYRIYRSLWILLPLVVVLFALTIRALQPPALVRIETEESEKDYVILTNEEIRLSFNTLDLNRDHLASKWFFGRDVSYKILVVLDSTAPEVRSHIEWQEGPADSMGIPLEVRFDTLATAPVEAWVDTNSAVDSTVVVRFTKPGRYKLKLEVKDTLRGVEAEHSREIEVFRSIPPSRFDTTLLIVGPQEGLVEEELVFFTTGEAINSWHWDFDDNKFLFEDKEQVVYSYANEGVYTIKCRINNSAQILEHQVTIRPTWNADSLPGIEIDTSQLAIDNILFDIKRHLQAISDASADQTKDFYWHWEYIERKYIAPEFKPIGVLVNGENAPVDFESYCQRIHVLEGNVVIDEVAVDWATLPGGRIRGLVVQQHKNTE